MPRSLFSGSWKTSSTADIGLKILERLAEDAAVVPFLWFYEIGNALTVACRRRITYEQAAEYLARIPGLPVSVDDPDPASVLALPNVARTYDLTNYDAAYLELAIRRKLPLSTTDRALRRAAGRAGIALVDAKAENTQLE